MTSTIRFGHQLRGGPIDELIEEAQAAEAAGFDVVSLPDHVGTDMASPLLQLVALARATTTIRLGTFVLNNEMRNPVQLAWEAATLDRLSGGRLELGLGAGHTPHEFAATGIPLRPAAERKARLATAVEVLGPLLAGEQVTRRGDHYDIVDAAVEPARQDRVPLLVGGNGRALLTHAARHADIVGLNGLGRTRPDGHRHEVRWSTEHLERQLAVIEDGARHRDRPLERNVLVQRVVITDDRERSMAADMAAVEGLDLADALATPYLAYGTHDEVAEQFLTGYRRWGLGYVVTRDLEAMAPVIARLRAAA